MKTLCKGVYERHRVIEANNSNILCVWQDFLCQTTNTLSAELRQVRDTVIKQSENREAGLKNKVSEQPRLLAYISFWSFFWEKIIHGSCPVSVFLLLYQCLNNQLSFSFFSVIMSHLSLYKCHNSKLLFLCSIFVLHWVISALLVKSKSWLLQVYIR